MFGTEVCLVKLPVLNPLRPPFSIQSSPKGHLILLSPLPFSKSPATRIIVDGMACVCSQYLAVGWVHGCYLYKDSMGSKVKTWGAQHDLQAL